MACKNCKISCNSRYLGKVIGSSCYRERTINIRGQRCTGGFPTTVTVMWQYTVQKIFRNHIDKENWKTTGGGETVSPVFNICEFNHASGSTFFGIDMSVADYPLNKRPQPIGNGYGRVVEIWRIPSCDNEPEETFTLNRMLFRATRSPQKWRYEIYAQTSNGNTKLPLFDGTADTDSCTTPPAIVGTDGINTCPSCVVTPGQVQITASEINVRKDICFVCDKNSWKITGTATPNTTVTLNRESSCVWSLTTTVFPLTLTKSKDLWVMDEMSVHDGLC
jgi:hypothetical protein